ncbi:hypothetical protein Scep_003951 [Stephania cephalantha]|uniref:Uncharacterized protein n=1 Tax=Stephania cephalantha TaxID=152367 RepID=A0AAP0KRH8_9MAGN
MKWLSIMGGSFTDKVVFFWTLLKPQSGYLFLALQDRYMWERKRKGSSNIQVSFKAEVSSKCALSLKLTRLHYLFNFLICNGNKSW